MRALEERVAGLFGKEAALFTPTGSMANVLAVRVAGRAGQEVLCEARAHIVRAELGAHGAVTGLTTRTWRGRPGGRPGADRGDVRARHRARSSCRPTAISVENTHNFAGGAVPPLERPAGGALGRRRAPASRCTSTAPGSGTRTSRPAPRSPTYGAAVDVLAVCLSKGLGAPVGSLVVGHRGRDRRGPGLAQAARRRHAPGRGAGGRRAATRSTTTSSGWPTTTTTRGCWPRRCGVDPADGRHATSWWSTCPTRAAVRRRAPREHGVLVSARSGPRGAPAGHPPRRRPRERSSARRACWRGARPVVPRQETSLIAGSCGPRDPDPAESRPAPAASPSPS